MPFTLPEVRRADLQSPGRTPGEWFYILLRYGCALLLLTYGFGKLFGAQFTVLDSELDKRLGRVSGFWLTWYYFSYSRVYGAFVALAQVAGAILLLFRRTTLLAVLLLLPVFINIALIDIFYSIDLGATTIAIVLLAALLVLLGIHREELIELLWRRQNRVFPGGPTAWPIVAGKWLLRVAMIAGAAAFAYWVANYNNRLPTPIDGAWRVVRMEPASHDFVLPQTIFFERNRAHLCVFKFNEFSYQPHHFDVDARAHSISIWQDWLKRGHRIFDGHYEIFRDRLNLTGSFTDGPADVTISLEKTD